MKRHILQGVNVIIAAPFFLLGAIYHVAMTGFWVGVLFASSSDWLDDL